LFTYLHLGCSNFGNKTNTKMKNHDV
jgi:hypothetical protein